MVYHYYFRDRPKISFRIFDRHLDPCRTLINDYHSRIFLLRNFLPQKCIPSNYVAWKNSKVIGSVNTQQNDGQAQCVKENNDSLEVIPDVFVCSGQGDTLRGNHEGEESHNRGFWHFLDFVSKYDKPKMASAHITAFNLNSFTTWHSLFVKTLLWKWMMRSSTVLFAESARML